MRKGVWVVDRTKGSPLGLVSTVPAFYLQVSGFFSVNRFTKVLANCIFVISGMP